MLVEEHLTGSSDDIIQLTGAESIVQAAGSECENDCVKTVNFICSTWQSCNGSKGCNKRKDASSSHEGRSVGDNGGKRRKHDPNFKPEAKLHPKGCDVAQGKVSPCTLDSNLAISSCQPCKTKNFAHMK